MIDDWMDSIRAQIYRNVKNPFFGAFIISFLFINYDFLLIYISDYSNNNTVDHKLNLIKELYSDCLFCGTWYHAKQMYWFIYPVISATIYILFYSLVFSPVIDFWLKGQNKLKAILQKHENEAPLTNEQVRKFREEMTDRENKITSFYARKDEEINNLTKNLQLSIEQKSKLDAENADKFEQIKTLLEKQDNLQNELENTKQNLMKFQNHNNNLATKVHQMHENSKLIKGHIEDKSYVEYINLFKNDKLAKSNFSFLKNIYDYFNDETIDSIDFDTIEFGKKNSIIILNENGYEITDKGLDFFLYYENRY